MASLAQNEPDEVRVSSGPYDFRVVTVNANLAAGFVQYSIFVNDAESGAAVPDARVVILTKSEGEDREGWANALNSPAFPDRYDARVNLDSTGDWALTVEVRSPLGFGRAGIGTLTVPSLQRYSSGSLVFFGVFGAIIAGVAYLIWSTKRNNRRRQAQN